ncbi:MAG: hypothetical protein Q9214_002840, partial [Letrouitia sp. 1 TL-2023]
MPPTSPFPPSSSTPGTGHIHLALQPPNHPAFETLAFSYPLKLVVSSAHTLPPAPPPSSSRQPASEQERNENDDAIRPSEVPLLFLLTYGGGLLAGDTISLSLTLDPGTRLTIATQGSTKVFKSPPSSAPTTPSTQDLTAHLAPHSALWLAPDPIQPFKDSHFAQTQTFHIPSATAAAASLGVLDWVTCGRAARGEVWALASYASRSDIYLSSSHAKTITKKKLLVRDAIKLGDGRSSSATLSQQRAQNDGGPRDPRTAMHGLALYGTLLLAGPVFAPLAAFFRMEFAALPRIGGREWAGASNPCDG